MPKRLIERARIDTRRAMEVWGDMAVLCLYYMWAWGVCLVTEPYLHWVRFCGSPYLAHLDGRETAMWGAIMLAVAVLSFHFQRWLGIVAVLIFTIIRVDDFALAGTRSAVLIGGCALIFVLALRGTVARWRRYG